MKFIKWFVVIILALPISALVFYKPIRLLISSLRSTFMLGFWCGRISKYKWLLIFAVYILADFAASHGAAYEIMEGKNANKIDRPG